MLLCPMLFFDTLLTPRDILFLGGLLHVIMFYFFALRNKLRETAYRFFSEPFSFSNGQVSTCWSRCRAFSIVSVCRTSSLYSTLSHIVPWPSHPYHCHTLQFVNHLAGSPTSVV
ncbi:hypothetical protein BJV78DRAFT_1221167 [Lactifluus subvellereus]|nr:hypothetical protein BJV78DRAFT_1221167 [Lactifluus subvellereus]